MVDLKADKLWLIDRIVRVEDAHLLQSLKQLLESNKDIAAESNSDFWQELSPQQQAQVERSIQQLDHGKGIAHADVLSEFRKIYAR